MTEALRSSRAEREAEANERVAELDRRVGPGRHSRAVGSTINSGTIGWEGGGNSTNAYDSKEAPRDCQEMHVLDVFVQAVASVVLEVFVRA